MNNGMEVYINYGMEVYINYGMEVYMNIRLLNGHWRYELWDGGLHVCSACRYMYTGQLLESITLVLSLVPL